MIDPRDLSALGRLLDTALDLPDDDARAHWLAQLGPEHESLKSRLVQLLAAHSAPSLPLDFPNCWGRDLRTAASRPRWWSAPTSSFANSGKAA